MRLEKEDQSETESPPVLVSSEHVERNERRDPFSKPTKNPKPNTNEDHEKERRDPFYSEILEWLQEFRENLVDDRVLNAETRTPVLHLKYL